MVHLEFETLRKGLCKARARRPCVETWHFKSGLEVSVRQVYLPLDQGKQLEDTKGLLCFKRHLVSKVRNAMRNVFPACMPLSQSPIPLRPQGQIALNKSSSYVLPLPLTRLVLVSYPTNQSHLYPLLKAKYRSPSPGKRMHGSPFPVEPEVLVIISEVSQGLCI